MSAFAAMPGSFATIFSFEPSKKWIIREGGNGISWTGPGAPTHSGLGERMRSILCLVAPPPPARRVVG